MAVEMKEIMDGAEKLGQLVAQHPAVARYKQAQKSVAEDAEAGRLMADFERQIEALGRQEQSGLPVTDAQRMQLEALQGRIVSHIKIKALNLAQVEFIDLLRKVSDTIRKQVQEPGAPGIPPPVAAAPSGPQLIF